MHTDPLCEVGCPCAVRGFDFDYLGLLWLGDLLWGDGRQSRMGWRRQHGWNAQLENTKVERQSPACSSLSAGLPTSVEVEPRAALQAAAYTVFDR
jgi:DUF2075 family protein